MCIEHQKRNGGFSLIELISVIVILGVISATGAKFLGTTIKAYFEGKGYIVADSQVRVALTRMTRELQLIRSATATDLTVTPSTEITFKDTSGASIRYYLSGTILMRNSQVLADGVSGLSLTYLQRDGKTTTTTVTNVFSVILSFNTVYGNSNRATRVVIHPRNIY